MSEQTFKAPNRLPTSSKETGTGDIDKTFLPGRPFRLAFLRCHFFATPEKTPSTAFAKMTMSLDSQDGAEYDCDLYSLSKEGGVGVGRDAQIIVTSTELPNASPWTFRAGDGIRVRWTNPGNVSWGLTIGFVYL